MLARACYCCGHSGQSEQIHESKCAISAERMDANLLSAVYVFYYQHADFIHIVSFSIVIT